MKVWGISMEGICFAWKEGNFAVSVGTALEFIAE